MKGIILLISLFFAISIMIIKVASELKIRNLLKAQNYDDYNCTISKNIKIDRCATFAIYIMGGIFIIIAGIML